MRTDSLTKAEADMGQMVKEFQQMKHFNVAMFVLKAFVENYVETSSDPKHPSLVDIGPVNTIFSCKYRQGYLCDHGSCSGWQHRTAKS